MKENLKNLLPIILSELKEIQNKDMSKLTMGEVEKRLSDLEATLTHLISEVLGDTERGKDGNTWVEWWLYERVDKKITDNGGIIDVTSSKDLIEFILKQKKDTTNDKC